MVATPKVIGPDGVARETTIFSTTISSRFFQGTMASDTVDMQISIRGNAFTSDPDLIVFEGTTFRFPNPVAFPDGLELAAGNNIIEVRSISFSGAVSASARVEATLVQEADIGLIGTPPSNISVEQLDDSVEIRAERVNDATFRGINFYASRFQGGGATGYQRINVETVTDFETVQETLNIGSLQTDNTVATNPDGTPAADPLYVQIKQTQTRTNEAVENLEDASLTPETAAAITFQEQQNLIKTDFVEILEVPETTTVLRTTLSVDSVVSRAFFIFDHNRQFGPANVPATVPIGEFSSAPITESLYYVTTAVFFDSARQVEIESAFSAEVVGRPVLIQRNVGTFPAPSRLGIVQTTIDAITRTTPQVAVQPGAVIRDTVVDPVSNEVTRLRLLVDFLYRIQSFDTLLQIDGVQSNGTSTPVARSPYKQALGRVFETQNPTDVQTIIDTAFEQQASRNGVFRLAGVRARGFVIFFRRARPTSTVFIPLGTIVASGGVQFATTTDASIPINNVGAFFNPSTGFYQILVPVEAQQPGTASNLGAGQIRTIVTSISGLSVTNPNATFGGRNQENNLGLSVRARRALASVDSGTEEGTLQVAANVAGVLDVRVVAAGDSLMQRDFDPDYDKHVGGKVDVWARGESLGNVTDTFAFTFEVATDVQFQVLGNPLALQFRALDDNLSPTNPIAQMLDDQTIGLGFRNASTGAFFDLTNVQVLDYRTIQLSSDVVQPTVSFGNILLGDYRYVTSTRFTFTRQPVNSVVSVTGQLSGELSTDNYLFVMPDDPLIKGRSTKAQSYLEIVQVNGVPSGDLIPITSEQHIMLGEFDEFLDNLGTNVLTVAVYNSGRTVLYRGPEDPSGISDYVIDQGTQTTPVAIRRTPSSQILSGETVLVDYQHVENFTVEYQTNFVIPTLQEALDLRKHLTADVLGKAAVPVPVDVTATIVTDSGTRASSVDTNVRTNITTFLRALPMGGAVRQSDIAAVIDNTRGVSYVELPFRKLTRSAGSLVVRETVPSAAGDVSVILGSTYIPYSTETVKTWLFENPLDNPTTQGGGDGTQFTGVFKDDATLTLQLTDPQALKDGADRAFIIGNEGLSIPGYSDDATIQTQFPAANTAAEIEKIRRDLTGNRLLVSLAAADRPELHTFTATYTVAFVEQRTQDLEAGPIEFFGAGNLIFTFTEDLRGV
jgi:uncharacterized phage protein gp47/JayE